GPTKGIYYNAYVMLDIFSRFIVGCVVHARESAGLAEEFMATVFGVYGIPKVVHADRGSSMTSKPVTALLSDLEVVKSHSRPKVSNDNPYSEAAFKTLKYLPEFPERFAKHQLPKTLQLPEAAWINQPTEPSQEDTQLAA